MSLQIVKFLLISNIILASGHFSSGYEKSINYSFSYSLDNENYYNYIDEENFEVVELKPKLYSAVTNIVFKGKYELGYEYLYNTSFINGYNLPYRGSYNYIYAKYHLKERDKFPINLSFNFKYGETGSFRNNNDYVFNSKSFGFGIYKEIDMGKYPLLTVLSLNKYSTYINDIPQIDYNVITIDLLLKLTVDNANNTKMRDIIWLGPRVSAIDDDQRIGFAVGLYHPIK